MSFGRIAAIVGIALLLVAAGAFIVFKFLINSLERDIASRWPKEDVNTVSELLEKDLSEKIATLGPASNAVVFVGKDELLQSVATSLQNAKGLSGTTFDLRPGFLLTESDFSFTTGNDGPKEANGLTVSGHVTAAVTAMVEAQNSIHFRFLLSRISNVEIKGKTASMLPKAVKDYVVKQVQDNLAQINGVLNGECTRSSSDQVIKLPSCLIEFPTEIPVALDVASSLEKQPQTTAVSATPVKGQFSVDHAAVYIGSSGLFGIAALRLAEDPNGPAPEPIPSVKSLSLEEIDAWFVKTANERMTEAALKTRAAVSVDRELVARSVAYIASAANLHLVQTFSTDPEKFDSEVRLAKRPSFSCDRDSCSREECRAVACHVEKNDICRGDIGGFFCKVVEKTICEPANAAGNLICNTVQEVSKGSCNVFEELKKGGCEANKAFVDKALGRVGRISGDYAVAGTYDIRVLDLTSSDHLNTLEMNADAGASANAHGTLHFTPLDQGNILICISQWQEPFNVSVELPVLTRHVTARFKEATVVDDGLDLKYGMEPMTLEGKVIPSPFDAVFTQHPHLRINCSLVADLGELARLIHIVDPENDIVPDELNQAVTGDIKKEVKDVEFKIHVPKLSLGLPSGKATMKPGITDRTLFFLTE